MALELMQQTDVQRLTVDAIEWNGVFVAEGNNHLGKSVIVELVAPGRTQIYSG